ncbi:MAG: LD-carboxypeptidase [Bacteroidota bacterium]|nr:LD-carboxypeptidase [Bacteroidota bacterium]MDX5431125.1 LD-carboxypeptidase [Bacteroidota bacterium]MDX5469874.1 LD-carboxypeptidase [Bacteroidota bacterium]
MKVPDFLKKGDRIGLFAPARKLNREEAEKAMAILKSWGLIPVLGKNIFGDEHQFSGTDEERAEDLHLFLEDPSIKAVIAFRGGYGCVRILPYLADHYAQAKWIIGYSDITVLHTWANQKLGWASLHATMPVNMIQEGPQRIESNESLRKALFGEPETLFVEGNHPPKEALLCGGNLSVIYSLLGSDLQLNSKGKFLFLEDLDEYLYHVDRMMQAIVRSGIGSKAAAWLIGGMSDMRDNAIPFGADPREIISNSHKGLVSPLAFGLEAGHQALNRAMIFGIPYRLEGSTLTPRL